MLVLCLEYASVGYMAKRIQMRKNRFLAIQKMAEQKKNEALHSSNANIHEAVNADVSSNMPKQTVSFFILFFTKNPGFNGVFKKFIKSIGVLDGPYLNLKL